MSAAPAPLEQDRDPDLYWVAVSFATGTAGIAAGLWFDGLAPIVVGQFAMLWAMALAWR